LPNSSFLESRHQTGLAGTFSGIVDTLVPFENLTDLLLKNMKLATTAKLPKKTSAKVNDPDNPAWTEDMLGSPVIKRSRSKTPSRKHITP